MAVQTVLGAGESQVQILLRLKVQRQRITEVELLVAREGDTCCWDPDNLETLSGAFEQAVPATRRGNREELVRLANAYFTALHTAGTSTYTRAVVAPTMERFENGKRTTNVPDGNPIIRRDAQTQLDSAMFGRISVVDRRYPVVDVEHGTILGVVVFEYPESTRPSEVIAEFFKIVNGTILEVRAIMIRESTTGWY